MSNKAVQKVPVNKQCFLEVLKLRNCSIRKLGNAYDEIQRTEKTIRRCLDDGEMPQDLLNRIAKYLNVHPDYLSGFYTNNLAHIKNGYIRALSKSKADPNRYPYLLKEKSNLKYTTYFNNILTMNDITKDLFDSLPPEARLLFRQEMDVAILEVIAKYFECDSLGHNLQEELDICKSLVGDYDPFSYYARLEGIGLPDPEFTDDDSTEDNSFADKYTNLKEL